MRSAAGAALSRLGAARCATAWIFFANGAALGSWIPHIPDAKHALALGDGMLGLALLGMAAGSLIGLPLSGFLTARFGSGRTTTAAIFALLLATPLPILAPSMPVFALALALLGTANGAVDVAMNAQAIAIEERYGRAIMSSFHALFSAGGLAGAAAAALAMEIGLDPTAHLLGAIAALSIVTLAAVSFVLSTRPSAMRTPLLRLPRGVLLVLGILTLCSLMAEGAIGDWAAVYLKDNLATGSGFAALGFAAFSFAMTAGRFLGDQVVRRYGGSTVLGTGTGAAAILLAAGLLAGTPAWALVSFAAVGLGLANAVPVLFSAAGKIPGTPPELAIAAVSTAGYCGFLLGPPAIGLIADHFSLPAGLGVIALSLAIVALGGTTAAWEGRSRWMVLSSAPK